MSPAKLHSARAPSGPAAPLRSPSPDLSNGLSHVHSGSTGAHPDSGVDTRPTTAQSYTSHRPDSAAMDASADLQRSTSRASSRGGDAAVSRSGTLKKKSSLSRKSSLKRSGSRKSLSAGGIHGVPHPHGAEYDEKDFNSALTTPIPTQSAPTDILANRFQAWRVFLKSLITYFREVQVSYETRAKAIMKVSNVVSNMQIPTIFMSDGGLADANRILTDYHKHAMSEANKSKDIERDVIQALNGLRADLGAKIKEIKNLHGDFKNTVEKEKEGTRRAIHAYEESLQHYEHADGLDKGRSDPFLVRLNVDRMVERQLDEENYLHRAYLNLESSGRELESIVVGEIQKAYNALAGIMKREADDAFNTVDLLRSGPISMQKDLEWIQFVTQDPHLVNPDLPLRRVQDIHYPGKDHPAAAEVRAGMLERKSKYLKSYTPGWYVLSPTHIHEFKSADNIYSQPPVMSLYLGDQKLGSHSGPDSNSHKFMLKGRQTGSMHRGHSWVFRAESHDTMMAWFDAIKSLTEKTGVEKTEYVRKHARSISGNSARAMSITSSDGMEEDEADHVPYAASVDGQQAHQPVAETRPQRPQPGGRFPSDLAVPRGEHAIASDYSSEPEQDHTRSPEVFALSNHKDHVDRPRTPVQHSSSYHESDTNPYVLQGVASHETTPVRSRTDVPREDYVPTSQTSYQSPLTTADTYAERPNEYSGHESHGAAPAVPTQTFMLPLHSEAPTNQVQSAESTKSSLQQKTFLEAPTPQPAAEEEQHNNQYGGYLGAAAAGAGAGAVASHVHDAHSEHQQPAVSREPALAPRDPVSRFSSSTVPSVMTADTDLTETGDAYPTTARSLEAGVSKPADMIAPMKRQHTDVSVSALHVPGEFPKLTPSGTDLAN